VINLRYHIVSIVAVFLALGIGLALGSTFVDSVLVSNLETQVDQLLADTDAAVAERDAAVAEAEELRSAAENFDALATPLLSRGKLDDTSVLIVAPDTVDRDTMDRLRDIVVASDTDFGGVLWLTESFDLADGPTRTALVEAFDLAGDSERAVRRAVTFLVSQALFAPEEAGDSVSERPTALVALRDAGLVVYDPSFGGGSISDLGRDGLRLLIVTDAAAASVNDGLLLPLLAEIADSGHGRSALLVELDDNDDYGVVLEGFRADPVMANEFSSVDGVETFEGVLAMVAALDQLPATGHYGRLDSAQSRLPQ
jgi:hypothetical protein